jgi:catalase
MKVSAPSVNQLGAWVLIIGIVAITIIAFGYVGGWLAPARLTSWRIIDQFQTNAGIFPGYRRNHAKGMCFAGYFQSNGQASSASVAQVFAPGQRTPVVGRFSIPVGNPYAPDSSVPIRSMALRFTLANGQQWRTGMNSMPVFPVSTPQAFYEQLKAQQPDPATGKPDPRKLAAFFASHPETAAFRTWAKTARPSASYAGERYNSLNTFLFVDAQGRIQPVRWGMVPMGQMSNGGALAMSAGEDDELAHDLDERLSHGPLQWALTVTLAAPSDPTNDATKAWPPDRRTIDAGTLVIEHAEPQASDACRDINYDPLILPDGIAASDDPLLPARSSAYADSYLRRTSEDARAVTASSKAGSK